MTIKAAIQLVRDIREGLSHAIRVVILDHAKPIVCARCKREFPDGFNITKSLAHNMGAQIYCRVCYAPYLEYLDDLDYESKEHLPLPIDRFFSDFDCDYPEKSRRQIEAARNDKGSPGPFIIVARETDMDSIKTTDTISEKERSPFPSRTPSPLPSRPQSPIPDDEMKLSQSPISPSSPVQDRALPPYPNIGRNILAAGDVVMTPAATAGAPIDQVLSKPKPRSGRLDVDRGLSIFGRRRSASRSRPSSPKPTAVGSVNSLRTVLSSWDTSHPHIAATIMRAGQIGTHITMNETAPTSVASLRVESNLESQDGSILAVSGLPPGRDGEPDVPPITLRIENGAS